MEKIEAIIGKFGQMSYKLFLKSSLYVVIYAMAIFLSVFLKELPTDPFLITKAILLVGAKAGLGALWEQFLVLVLPYIISIARTDKK